MKIIEFKSQVIKKINSGEVEYSSEDLINKNSSFIPGEWALGVVELKNKEYCYFIFYINTFSLQNKNIKLLKLIKKNTFLEWQKQAENIVAIQYLEFEIIKSIERRWQYHGYELNARLVYGKNDNLPGLIVDSYSNICLVQINTAGMDRFRSHIEMIIEKKVINPIEFLDHDEYRKQEVLPKFDKKHHFNVIKIVENKLNIEVKAEVMQKIGHYYDHRENRLRLIKLLNSMKIKFKNGLDLFCYTGTWGLNLLSAGVDYVEFVDQGNFSETLNHNLKINNFEMKGNFVRSDVFKFLSEAKSSGKKYQIVVSDPPAFAKSQSQVAAALRGYEKLHTEAMQLVETGGVFVCASCTHGVGIEELDATVKIAAQNIDREIQLVDIGLQGYDHPITNLKDKSFYIKYLAYIIH